LKRRAHENKYENLKFHGASNRNSKRTAYENKYENLKFDGASNRKPGKAGERSILDNQEGKIICA
jgi:hypothetical protein